MKKLLISVHPKLRTESIVNKKLVEEIVKHNAVDTTQDLYSLYPDFKINIEEQQKLLKEHDLIIFQYPIWWYTMPPLGHHWINEVLLPGFAYAGAHQLEGKKWLTVVTTGSPDTSYRSGAKNNFTLSEMLKPMQQTVNYCKMEWLPVLHINPYSQSRETVSLDEYLEKKAQEYIKLLSLY